MSCYVACNMPKAEFAQNGQFFFFEQDASNIKYDGFLMELIKTSFGYFSHKVSIAWKVKKSLYISGVFLLLYLGLAIREIAILARNKRVVKKDKEEGCLLRHPLLQ